MYAVRCAGPAPVAQWIEQPPPKRKVASSTLAWGTQVNAQVRQPNRLLTCVFVIEVSVPDRDGLCRVDPIWAL